MRVVCFVIALLFAPGVCVAADDRSTWEEYGAAFVGTWRTSVKLDADLPSGEKKGDVVESKATIRWILKKKAIETVFSSGWVRGKTLEAWDPQEKCVRWSFADSTGSIGSGTCVKTGDHTWVTKGENVNGEGVSSSNTGKLTITDGGNTHSWVATDRKEGDRSLPDKTEVWRRVMKAD